MLQPIQTQLNDLVTQSEAEERCAAFGGLASFEHFNPPPGTRHHGNEPKKDVPMHLIKSIHNMKLHEGESVWVSGKAHYSRFMAWYMNTSIYVDTPDKDDIHGSDLYECSTKCKQDQWDLLGITTNKCYCMNETSLKGERSDDELNVSLNLYKLLPDDKINFENGLYQCTNLMYDNKYIYSTSKCSININGLCQEKFKKTNELNFTCLESRSVCAFTHDLNWVQNRDYCLQHNGQLLPFWLDQNDAILPQNTKYALAMFRSFTAVSNYKQVTTTCLSVTHVENALWLEPDNCSEKRRYVCNNITDAPIVTRNTILTIIIVVCVVLLLVTAIIIGYAKRHFLMACIGRKGGEEQHNRYDEPVKESKTNEDRNPENTVNSETGDAIEPNANHIDMGSDSETNIRHEVPHCGEYSVIGKRHTGRHELKITQPETDYDHVNMDYSSGEDCGKQACTAEGTGNIYDRTNGSFSADVYNTASVSGVQRYIADDASSTFNHARVKRTSETYDHLGQRTDLGSNCDGDTYNKLVEITK